MISPDVFQRLFFWGKVAGALGAFGGILWPVIRFLRKWFKKVCETHDTISLLATNHIPHIQESLKEHGEALSGIRSDVRQLGTVVEGVNTRLEDTKTGLHSLGIEFVRHLAHTSEEPEEVVVEPPKKKRKK
jgi:hypothetical protein